MKNHKTLGSEPEKGEVVKCLQGSVIKEMYFKSWQGCYKYGSTRAPSLFLYEMNENSNNRI